MTIHTGPHKVPVYYLLFNNVKLHYHCSLEDKSTHKVLPEKKRHSLCTTDPMCAASSVNVQWEESSLPGQSIVDEMFSMCWKDEEEENFAGRKLGTRAVHEETTDNWENQTMAGSQRLGLSGWTIRLFVPPTISTVREERERAEWRESDGKSTTFRHLVAFGTHEASSRNLFIPLRSRDDREMNDRLCISFHHSASNFSDWRVKMWKKGDKTGKRAGRVISCDAYLLSGY